jgi:protein SCO1/2
MMQTWTELQFRDAVASAAAHPVRGRALLDLLAEEHPAYAQQSTAEVVRRRGWVLVQLGGQALPAEALPFLLEELQSGQSAYLLAAAAFALRQAPSPSPAFLPALRRADEVLRQIDDVIELANWGGSTMSESAATARDEVQATMRWLGPDAAASEAQCCGMAPPWWPQLRARGSIHRVRFQDQAGESRTWDALFTGQASIVAFFYTRCDNEAKCSLTICKLARVQRLLTERALAGQIRIAAISYDPDFDSPQRLQVYARNRGLEAGDHCSVLRTVEKREVLARYFNSGVNFISSLVNRHRIELFLLDADGNIAGTFQRLEWDPETVVDEAAQLALVGANAGGPRGRGILARMTPALWAIGIALLPKCPICGVTYLSMGGIAAFSYMPGWSQAWPILALLLLVNLAALGWVARARRNASALGCSALGSLLLIGPGLALGSEVATLLGAAAVLVGSALTVWFRTRQLDETPATDTSRRARSA